MREVAAVCVYCGSSSGERPERAVFRREVAHRGLTELIEVDSMHERKRKMFELSDAFVALAGGIGTLDELAEVASWAQLGLHDKPIATLDVAGYWHHLHAFLQDAVSAGFMKPDHLGLIVNVDAIEALLPTLYSYSVAYTDKWIGPKES